MSEQRAAGQAREQRRLVDRRLREKTDLLLLWSRQFPCLDGTIRELDWLFFLSGDDGCYSSGGTQLPHLWIPIELVSSLFFLPFCIQVFKGLIPLKTEEKKYIYFRKLQLASAGVDNWNEGLVKARRLNSQVFIWMLPSDGGVESAPVRTCSPLTTFVQFFCSLLGLTRQIDCCAPSQLVPRCRWEFSKSLERSLLV